MAVKREKLNWVPVNAAVTFKKDTAEIFAKLIEHDKGRTAIVNTLTPLVERDVQARLVLMAQAVKKPETEAGLKKQLGEYLAALECDDNGHLPTGKVRKVGTMWGKVSIANAAPAGMSQAGIGAI